MRGFDSDALGYSKGFYGRDFGYSLNVIKLLSSIVTGNTSSEEHAGGRALPQTVTCQKANMIILLALFNMT